VSTNSGGSYTNSSLEWDSYNFTFTDPAYDIVGTNPASSVNLAPDSTQNIELVVGPKDPKTLLVSVKDLSTGLPVSSATVTLLDASSTVEIDTKVTGRGFVRQTDWSGGGGQADFVDETRYLTSDGNIETNLPAGELRLENSFGIFETYGELTSSTFDVGSSTDFHDIVWTPASQPPAAGADSVAFQIATNNDNLTWNYLGPDGSTSTVYTLADLNINPVHNGTKYLRYKAILTTADTAVTPNLAEVAFTFTSSCTPPGQVAFQGLAPDDYAVRVTKTGYQAYETVFTITGDWVHQEIFLSP
jgi:hypothetical protein